jgi:hypothetical protein
VGVNFFQQYRAKHEEIKSPTIEAPVLPKEEATQTIDTVKPIHVDDAQYALLTLALRPGITPVREGLEVDPSGPSVPPVVDNARQPPADQPPGTPIV